MASWRLAAYRNFWDFPRMVVATNDSGTFLYYSRFEEALDDYTDYYAVYRMPELTLEELQGTWEGLEERALERLADVPIRSLPFDVTHREFLDYDALHPERS